MTGSAQQLQVRRIGARSRNVVHVPCRSATASTDATVSGHDLLANFARKCPLPSGIAAVSDVGELDSQGLLDKWIVPPIIIDGNALEVPNPLRNLSA